MLLRQITGAESLGSEGSSVLKYFSSLGARKKEAALKASPPQLRHLSQPSCPSGDLQSPLHMLVRKDWKTLCHQTAKC